MLATLFKFVMLDFGWKVWDSLLQVDQFAKMVALLQECPSKEYVGKWCAQAQDFLANDGNNMSFADSILLDTLSKTLHSIFCVSSSKVDVDDILDAMSSHREKACQEVVTFLE